MSAPHVSGDCWVHFAFDVAAGIDLEHAERAVQITSRAPGATTSREEICDQRRTPPGIQFRPKPLRIVRPQPPIELDGGGSCTEPQVEITLYDFGAISIAYRIRFDQVDLEALRRLSNRLVTNGLKLEVHARSIVEFLLLELGDAARRVSIAETVEDYLVFHIERCHAGLASGQTVAGINASATPANDAMDGTALDLTRDGAAIAAILRSAEEALSPGEIADALACVIAYGRRDLAVIDWNAAIIVEPDRASAADLLAVLEYANVELVELRFLDDRLDGVLDRSYRTLSFGDQGDAPANGSVAARSLSAQGRRGLLSGWSLTARRERQRLAAMHMDSVLLFEGVNNAIKLLGDQYLARVYRLAARRFHLAEWDAAILRKIETLQRLYEKQVDDQATRRMEVLEWIIIALIAISIVVMFIPGAK